MEEGTDSGPIKQDATTLLTGWGYRFYRVETQLRADDLLVRAKVSGILARARAALREREAEYRRLYLPIPLRSDAFPDRARFEQARMLERSGAAIESVAAAIRAAPSPASDWVWLRHRDARGLQTVLETIDLRLVDAAVAFHDRIVALDLVQVSDPGFESALGAWLRTLRVIVGERAERLSAMV